MRFTCDGQHLDTEKLRRFNTGSAAEPAVYLTPDLTRVFVEVADAWTGPRIRRADPVEIRRLWRTHGIHELRTALKTLESSGDAA